MVCFFNEVYRRKYNCIILRWIRSGSGWAKPPCSGFCRAVRYKVWSSWDGALSGEVCLEGCVCFILSGAAQHAGQQCNGPCVLQLAGMEGQDVRACTDHLWWERAKVEEFVVQKRISRRALSMNVAEEWLPADLVTCKIFFLAFKYLHADGERRNVEFFGGVGLWSYRYCTFWLQNCKICY